MKVSWSDISGGNIKLSEVPLLTSSVGDKVIDVVDVVFGEGKYGPYAVITTSTGEQYRTGSGVLISQLRKIKDYLDSHDDVIGVRVKVAKVKNYYTFEDAGGDENIGIASWSEVGGRRRSGEKLPNISEKMNQVVTITGVEEYEGRFGPYWVIHTTEGDYYTSSKVLGQQGQQIDEFIKTHPDVEGVDVKIVKVKNYYKFEDPDA